MNTRKQTFTSMSAKFEDAETGTETLFFSAPDDRLFVVSVGEAVVCLNAHDQTVKKNLEEWEMLLVSRGMLLPKATTIAQLLMEQQQQSQQTVPQISVGNDKTDTDK